MTCLPLSVGSSSDLLNCDLFLRVWPHLTIFVSKLFWTLQFVNVTGDACLMFIWTNKFITILPWLNLRPVMFQLQKTYLSFQHHNHPYYKQAKSILLSSIEPCKVNIHLYIFPTPSFSSDQRCIERKTCFSFRGVSQVVCDKIKMRDHHYRFTVFESKSSHFCLKLTCLSDIDL